MSTYIYFKKILCCLDKDRDETTVVFRGDMELTIGQIIGPRTGQKFSKKWPEGKVPYTFQEYIPGWRFLQEERNVIQKVFKRFNKDLKGCLRVRYLLLIKQKKMTLKIFVNKTERPLSL